MKKFLSVVFGGMIALTLFVTTGNTAKAAETHQPEALSEECGCDVTPILGSERNKIVADVISSEAFKAVKNDLKKDDLKWTGANTVEVFKNNTYGMVMVGVPFENKEGTLFMAVFFDGVFMGLSPADAE